MSDNQPETGTENTPETGAESKPETGTNTTPETGTVDAEELKKQADYWKSQADKQERRAKANADAAKELERLKREELPAAERAVAEAVDSARTQLEVEMRTRYGGRLVVAEIRAAAKGRLSDEQLHALTSRLNVASFLTEEGEVDAKEVERWVNGIVPPEQIAESDRRFPDLGQGARSGGSVNGQTNDPLLRDLKSALGIAT